MHRRAGVLRPSRWIVWAVLLPLSAVYAATAALGRLLGERTAIALFRIALAVPHVLSGGRRVNLQRVLHSASPRELRAVEREYARYQARLFGEYALLDTLEDREVLSRVALEGLDNLRSACARGRGVLLIGSHLGNWYHIPVRLALEGYRLAGSAYDIPIPSIMAQTHALGNRYGFRAAIVGGEAARIAREQLRRGGLFYLLFEASVRPEQSAEFRLGGGVVRIDTGPARMALMLKVPIVYADADMLEGGRSRIRISPPFELNASQTPEEVTTTWVAHLEEEIRKRPGHWWFWNLATIRRPPV